MDTNQTLVSLTNKVQEGTSTPEEELILLKNLNHSTQLCQTLIEETRAAHENK